MKDVLIKKDKVKVESKLRIWQDVKVSFNRNMEPPKTSSAFQNITKSLTNSEVCKICCASSGVASM